MTLMRAAPVPTFGKSIRALLVASTKETMMLYGLDVQEEPQIVKTNMLLCGDYLAGVRMRGKSFQGAITLGMDGNMAKELADRVDFEKQKKDPDALFCDLVGAVSNQFAIVFLRKLGELGCHSEVNAHEVQSNLGAFDTGIEPSEWLLTPFIFRAGRGVFSFGLKGSLDLSDDELGEDGFDVRKITFF